MVVEYILQEILKREGEGSYLFMFRSGVQDLEQPNQHLLSQVHTVTFQPGVSYGISLFRHGMVIPILT